jgi:hypothetical protein
MSASTVPISEASHQILRDLAAQIGDTMTEVLDSALDSYHRRGTVIHQVYACSGLS